MPAVLAAGERHDLALLEVTPTVGGSKRGLTVEHDHQLLLGEMVVVGVCGFARWHLPQTETQTLAPRLSAETGALASEARMLAWLVKDGIVEIRHAPEPMTRTGGLRKGASHAQRRNPVFVIFVSLVRL
jgi:hypothetical protein